VRGPGGGYNLARPMEQLTIADIIIAVDEPLDATRCGGLANCQDEQRCMTHDLWVSLNEKIYEYLSSVTLKEMVDRQKPANVTTLEDRRPRRSTPTALSA
jgi:Rrf2 family iron-sulfur cluster assembly transcriptional regulator